MCDKNLVKTQFLSKNIILLIKTQKINEKEFVAIKTINCKIVATKQIFVLNF